ncbi:ATP-binding protein [Mucilaginibacter sp. dw_454]|uniref:ATP-binding protein n=1 Tax=Mucilaginibacter sp. dw_454 TaxID=2720079 RepID=UPI001BD65771|nr:ATP-binding protein [Mucilaginibacter sp. dw_454]
MIVRARKIPILRYVLIIALISLLFGGTEYLYLRYKKAQLLRGNIENVITSRENSALIDTCIYRLYSADNSSRLYTITGDKTYLRSSSADMNKVLATIDKIKFGKQEVTDPDKFKRLVQDKIIKTNDFIKLRLQTNYLIKRSEKVNQSLNHIQTAKPELVAHHVTTIDTVKIAPTVQAKKKFFGRVIASLSRKKEPEKAKTVIVAKDTVIYSQKISKATIQSGKTAYNYSKKINAANKKLVKGEQQILQLNNNLAQEIIASLKGYKAIEQAYINHSKAELRENLGDVFSDFSRGALVSFILLVLVLIAVFYNIWKIFRNEQDIIDYSNSAEKYAQLKSKFLAGMSHEIRTPLNSVIGFSEQLSQEDLPPSQKEQVAAIRNSSEMILDLVNEILDFSKYETGKMNFESAPFMLNQVISEVYSTMTIHAMKKGIGLENLTNIDDTICCEGDKMRLKQVLMNLTGNAIKFTRQGKVTIQAKVELTLGNNFILKVRVVDTGIGIDKNHLPHVFDEFSQVAEAQKATRHKGTGLGLAICKKIIELQGGSITVTSASGQGSVFSFELPFKQLEDVDCYTESNFNSDLLIDLVRDKNILLADDNKLNVLLAKTILKKWNIKCDVAYDGQEALDLFKINNYDMVLTDIQMPVMDGLQLTGQIRHFSDPVKSKIIIMALTANVMKEDRDIYLATGVNDVVLKPFLEKDLIEKIASAIQNNSTALKFIA